MMIRDAKEKRHSENSRVIKTGAANSCRYKT